MAVDTGTTCDNTPVTASECNIFESCRNGDIDRVKQLLHNQSVNDIDSYGRKSTPLHFAAGKASHGEG
jgi:hypothetical protein